MRSRILSTAALCVFSACAQAPEKPEVRTVPFVARDPNYVSVADKTPQQIDSRGTSENDRTKLLSAARAAFKSGNFPAASGLYRDYLDRFSGRADFERAQMEYAESLFRAGRADEAASVLQPALETPHEKGMYADGRLLYAEMLIDRGRFDEAVAVTYDVLPDFRAEKKAGIKRTHPHIEKLSAAQETRLFTLRGRVFAELDRQEDSEKALADARASMKKVPKSERTHLAAETGWRQIQTLSAICRHRVEKPTSLSEAEFLDWSGRYFDCADPSRTYYCEILAAKDESIRKPALESYKSLVLFPGTLKDPLPPPSRGVKESQKPFYEKEMRALIDTTLDASSKPYRNLEKCNAFDLF